MLKSALAKITFVADPMKRATVDDIRKHEWFKKVNLFPLSMTLWPSLRQGKAQIVLLLSFVLC